MLTLEKDDIVSKDAEEWVFDQIQCHMLSLEKDDFVSKDAEEWVIQCQHVTPSLAGVARWRCLEPRA